MPVFEGWCSREVLRSAVSVESGDGDQQRHRGVIDVLETTEALENNDVEIRTSHPQKMVGSKAQLWCIYTSAHSKGNKQDELEAIV